MSQQTPTLQLRKYGIGRLRLRRGDVIVITMPDTASDIGHRRAYQQVKRIFPNHDVVMLDGGTKIQVVKGPAK